MRTASAASRLRHPLPSKCHRYPPPSSDMKSPVEPGEGTRARRYAFPRQRQWHVCVVEAVVSRTELSSSSPARRSAIDHSRPPTTSRSPLEPSEGCNGVAGCLFSPAAKTPPATSNGRGLRKTAVSALRHVSHVVVTDVKRHYLAEKGGRGDGGQRREAEDGGKREGLSP